MVRGEEVGIKERDKREGQKRGMNGEGYGINCKGTGGFNREG